MKKQCLLIIMFLMVTEIFISGQGADYGINYQAVARDNFGKEITNKSIDVKFSVISGNPLGTTVYQELHSGVRTSRYGVFSITIGKGTPVGGIYNNFSLIRWPDAAHYLKVEVKFEDSFLDMGTMQFLAVPYALYALKSLEAGPPGPQGPAGDPASDDQTLSFDGNNLAISGGNTVNLNALENDADPSPTNELQDLKFESNKLSLSGDPTPTEIDLSHLLNDGDFSSVNELQDLSFAGNKLTLSGDPTPAEIDLSALKDDADANPTNEIQDLQITGNILSLSGDPTTTNIDLSHLQNDADISAINELQHLDFSANKLTLSGDPNPVTIDLTPLEDDADANPTNEIQDLQMTGNILTLTGDPVPTFVDLSHLQNDADISISNEIQDLAISGNKLTLTNDPTPVEIDLTFLEDDADPNPANEIQDLQFSGNILSLTGDPTATNVDLSHLQNDADISATNEIQDLSLSGNILTITNKTSPSQVNLGLYLDNTDNQTLTYNTSTNTLSISGGNNVSFGSRVAFRAKKTVEETGLSTLIDYDFVTPNIEYNIGNNFNNSTGIFKATEGGLYCFSVGYNAGSNGDIKTLKIFLNNILYEILNSNIATNSSLTRTIMMTLNSGDEVKVVINIGFNPNIAGSGTGSFSGYRIY